MSGIGKLIAGDVYHQSSVIVGAHLYDKSSLFR